MAIRRSGNFLSQQRIDTPHLKSIESAVRSDFDELIGAFAIGEGKSYIIRGFELNMTGAIGSSANSLQLIVDGSSLFHGASDVAGTFYQVPSGTSNEVLSSTTNEKVQGSFTPSALNYVGIEFIREVNNTTTGQSFFWNPTSKSELSKTVPQALTLEYQIVITSSVWASNVLPITVVETDSSNNVISVQDRRPMLFRLGTGGTSTPNPFYSYPWTNHAEGRVENPYKSTSSDSPFRGGDKQLLHFKEWADAIMSSLLEIKGTTYWYSANKGGSIVKLRNDLVYTQLTGSGKFSHSATTPGQMNWDCDLFLNLIGSRLSYKINSNTATTDVILADNQVAYIKLIRGVSIAPKLIFTNSSAIVTSVGAASWTGDILAGDFIKLEIEDDTLYYEVLSVDSASQITLTETYKEISTGSSGASAVYAYGTYETNPTPSTDRHVQVEDRKDVPFDEDTCWLFFRADNGGATAKIYIRGSSGGEIEQGEDREISDNETLNHLEYVGSKAESDSTPDYTNSIVTGVAEETTFTFPAASALTTGQYFLINSANNIKKFYVWANIDSAGGDPTPAGLFGVEVALLSGDTNLQVAAKYHSAIDAQGEFNSVNNLDGTITATNSQVGSTDDASNVDMGAGFSLSIDVNGVGSFNVNIVDDENLTKSIKRLDEATAGIQNAIDVPQYEEIIEVVSGAPANDNEIQGPVTIGTPVTIPLNARNSNVQEYYVVGDADIDVYFRSRVQCVGKDFTEIGALGSNSTQIQFTFQLEVGDYIKFKKPSGFGGGSGSGGSSTGVNLGSASDANVFKQVVGSEFQFRRITAGVGMTITENSSDIVFASTPSVAPATVTSVSGSNYVASVSDDVILLSNMGADRMITLPNAASATGHIFDIKKIDSGNTMFIKSVSGQTLDGVNIDATPHSISIQWESITIVSDGANWFII